jgi:hypothetical protein
MTGYTAEELIQAAGLEAELKENNLAPLVRAGLLPHRERHGLGRGRGVRMEFPAWAVEQLQAVQRYRQYTHNWRRLRLALWAAGFDIDWKRIRADMADILRTLDAIIGAWRDSLSHLPAEAVHEQVQEQTSLALERPRRKSELRIPLAGLARTEREIVTSMLFLSAIERRMSLPLLAPVQGQKRSRGEMLATVLSVEDATGFSESMEHLSDRGWLDASQMAELVESATEAEMGEARAVFKQVSDIPGAPRILASLSMSLVGYAAATAGVLVALREAQASAPGRRRPRARKSA